MSKDPIQHVAEWKVGKNQQHTRYKRYMQSFFEKTIVEYVLKDHLSTRITSESSHPRVPKLPPPQQNYMRKCYGRHMIILSSNLQVTRTGIKSCDKLRLPANATSESIALEHWNKCCGHDSVFVFDCVLSRIGINRRVRLDQMEPKTKIRSGLTWRLQMRPRYRVNAISGSMPH